MLFVCVCCLYVVVRRLLFVDCCVFCHLTVVVCRVFDLLHSFVVCVLGLFIVWWSLVVC